MTPSFDQQSAPQGKARQSPTRSAAGRIAARLRGGTALAGRAGLLIAAAMLVPGTAFANPDGGTVVAGTVAIRPGAPGQLDIVQSTPKAIIDWRRFGVGEGEHTRFQQPDANAIALNRVVGPDPSAILGRLSANGQVWLVNPNGIVFGPNAKVDVGGLIATTHNIRNDDFLAGRYLFEGQAGSTATVENNGVVTVAQAGLAAFVAPFYREVTSFALEWHAKLDDADGDDSWGGFVHILPKR